MLRYSVTCSPPAARLWSGRWDAPQPLGTHDIGRYRGQMGKENRMTISRFLVAGLLATALAGCGDPDSVKETKTGSDGGRGRTDIYASGASSRKRETVSLFGPRGPIGSTDTRQEGAER